MRIVFSGASPTAIAAAQQLIDQGHDIIVIEVNKQKIDQISEKLDCGFLHGDAGKPAILNQVDPKQCDFLFCLTDNDQANIITSLLGRSLGFKRVVTSIENAELEEMCREIELRDIIIPAQSMSRHIENMVKGLDNIQLSTLLKGDARFFSFIAGKSDEKTVSELDLPEGTKCIYFYRDDTFHLIDDQTRFKEDDEIILLTDVDSLPELNDRWEPTLVEGD